MEGHNCSNNQVWKMPMEFYQFVKEQPLELKLELPFLTDLLWFEWLEIELYSEEDIPVDNFRKDGNWRNNTVVLNPHYRTVCFEYPVFRPQVNLEHCERGSYYLLLLRNLKDYKVKLLEISELFYATLQQNPQNFKESLLQVAKSRFGIQDEELVLKKAQPTVELFFQKGLFLGFN
jgi:hypothetical protein